LATLLGIVYALSRSPTEVNVNTDVIANPEVGARNYLSAEPPGRQPTEDQALLDDMTGADWWKNGGRPPGEDD
jgi:hypothetical protein